MRLFNRVPEVKAVFACLWKSMLGTANFAVVAGLIVLIFAIVGMEVRLRVHASRTAACASAEVAALGRGAG